MNYERKQSFHEQPYKHVYVLGRIIFGISFERMGKEDLYKEKKEGPMNWKERGILSNIFSWHWVMDDYLCVFYNTLKFEPILIHFR